MKINTTLALLTTTALATSLIGCGASTSETVAPPQDKVTEVSAESTATTEENNETKANSDNTATSSLAATSKEERASIEEALNLANNNDVTWAYDQSADAWVMSIVTAVANAEIEDEEGVSVCVPGAYVTGIDTDGDGAADVTAGNYSEAVSGSLVIDY